MNAQTTNTGLFILAFISAVMNYAGFTHIIDTSDWWLKALCFLTSIGVWICLYLFWQYAFSIIPNLRMQGKRTSGWLTVAIGCFAIISLSTYWNVIAYTGKEVLQLSQTANVTRAEQKFAKASAASTGFTNLIPQLEALSASASSLADGEEFNGSVTGSRGKGAVSELMRQIADKVGSVASSLRKAEQSNEALKTRGKACLANMRSADNQTYSKASADKLAAGADCLNSVLADMGSQDMASGVVQAMSGLRQGVVMPVSINSAKQRQALNNVLDGLQGQANTIAKAAQAIPRNSLTPFEVQRPNMASAVLLHWKGIIPAIATALAIDLLPLLLLILGVLLHRDGEAHDSPRHAWTIQELDDAQQQLAALRGESPQKLIEYKATDQDTSKDDDHNADRDGETSE